MEKQILNWEISIWTDIVNFQKIVNSIKIGKNYLFSIFQDLKRETIPGSPARSRAKPPGSGLFILKRKVLSYKHPKMHLLWKGVVKEQQKGPLPGMPRLGAHRLDTPTISQQFHIYFNRFHICIYIYIYKSICSDDFCIEFIILLLF